MEAPHEFVSFYDEMEDFGCRSQPSLQPRCILPKIECLMQDIPYTTVSIDSNENDDNDDTGSESDIFGMDLESLRSLWPSYEPSTSEHHYIATDDWFDDDPNLNQTAIENSVIDDNFNINHNQQTPGENSCASVMEEIFDESHVSIKMEPTIEFFSSDEYVNENDHIYGDFANSKLTLDNEHEETDYETKKREQIERNKELMWLLSPIRKQNEILREKHQNQSKHPPMRRQKFSLTNRILRPKRKQHAKTMRKNLSLERWQQEVATKLNRTKP